MKVPLYQHFWFLSFSLCPTFSTPGSIWSVLPDSSFNQPFLPFSPTCPVTEQPCWLLPHSGFLYYVCLKYSCVILQDGIRKKRMELIEKERKQREQVSALLSPYAFFYTLSYLLIPGVFRCSCWKQSKWRDMKKKRCVVNVATCLILTVLSGKSCGRVSVLYKTDLVMLQINRINQAREQGWKHVLSSSGGSSPERKVHHAYFSFMIQRVTQAIWNKPYIQSPLLAHKRIVSCKLSVL